MTPEGVIASALRLVVIGLASYVGLIVAAGALSRAIRFRPGARLLDRITPTVARSAIAGITALIFGAASPAGAQQSGAPPVVMHKLPDDPAQTVPPTTVALTTVPPSSPIHEATAPMTRNSTVVVRPG